MGIVWAARDELLARPVAVKEVWLPASVDDGERELLRERTLREARAAARLDHACAVRVFDVCEENDLAFIVMELVEGRTLSDVVHTDGPVAPARAAELGGCVLDALTAAHAAGIIHRDVKPGNILVRPDGRVTLTDFGIASTAGDSSITSTGLLLGSPAYIAPERARGLPPEPSSDLWSLAATLYTVVEGRPPFDRQDPVATLMAVVTDEPAPWERAGPLLGPLLERMLAKDPADRPPPEHVRMVLRQVALDPDAQVAYAARPRSVATRGRTVAVAPVSAAAVADALEPPLAQRALAWALMCVVVFMAAAAAAATLHG